MKTATKPRASVAPIFLKMATVKAQNEFSRLTELSDAYRKAGAATFVSTSAQMVTRGEDHIHDEILYVVNTAYYRLTPIFWGWLRHSFNNATRACETGKMDGSTYSELLDRVSRVYNMALAQFGADTLISAEQTFSLAKWKRYCERLTQKPEKIETDSDVVIPTSSYRFPENGDGAIHPVLGSSIEQVDAIRDRAITAGWTLPQLYRNIGIAHRDWGLVCYLAPSDRIGAITSQSIEIINKTNAGDHSLHFYNHEVDQPWLRRK